MLVVFTNKSGGTVEMFEKPAFELIKLMGRREAAPSAISAEDLPDALATLQNALIEMNRVAEEAEDDNDIENEEDDKPASVGISTRAFPLTELMKQTIKDGSFFMWDYK